MPILARCKHTLFLFHKKILEGDKTLFKGFCKKILYGISLGFSSCVWVRNFLYDLKIFSQKTANVPVISIGNIVAGGTGKTPLAIHLIKSLHPFIDKIAVLSRGYGRYGRSQILQGFTLNRWEDIGDEPKLIANSCPYVSIFVGKKREKTAQIAHKKNAQILILDDGLQYRRLKRDFEIICVNSKNILGDGYFLPRGFLRDSPKRLAKAHMIMVHHIETEESFIECKKKLQKYTQAPICAMRPVIKACVDSQQRQVSIQNRAIAIYCAIADPNSFINLVQKENPTIILKKIDIDHQPASYNQWKKFVDLCQKKSVQYIVCTEKDYVKLPTTIFEIPVIQVKIELEIIYEKHNWDLFIEKIGNIVDN